MLQKIVSIVVAVLILTAVPCLAEQPIDALKGPVEQVIALLRDPRYKDPANFGEQREKMWVIAHQVFDFEAMARGTLTRYRWDSFSPAQREAFVDVFTRFLGNNYFNQIQGKYHNEQVVFLGEEMQGERKALVKTQILREAIQIPVDYSMWSRDGKWRIFNVYIEGTSLLGNYRSEFERVLMDGSADGLIQLLKKKVEEQERTKPHGN